VRLVLASTGGELEFDCARGAMTSPVVVESGRFRVPGYYVAQHGGPAREDEVEVRVPTTYTGQVSGATLTLSFRLGDAGFGPFSLTRDRAPRLTKCL